MRRNEEDLRQRVLAQIGQAAFDVAFEQGAQLSRSDAIALLRDQ